MEETRVEGEKRKRGNHGLRKGMDEEGIKKKIGETWGKEQGVY